MARSGDEKRGRHSKKEKKAAAGEADPNPTEDVPSSESAPAAEQEAELAPQEASAEKKGKTDESIASATQDNAAQEVAERAAGEEKQNSELEQKDDTAVGQAVEAEIAQLDAVKVTDRDMEEMFQALPSDISSAATDIATFARDISASVDGPEIVLVGKQAHGKGSVLEALLGFRVHHAQTSNRPTVFSLIHDSDCKDPKVTIKADQLKKEHGSSVRCNPGDLPRELAKRATKTLSTQLIRVQYVSADVPNLTIYDAPDLGADSAVDIEERRAASLELMRPGHRMIIAVEEATKDWDALELVEFAKKADLQLGRTVFALTKLHAMLQTLGSVRDLNQLLTRRPASARGCVFLTLFSPEVAVDCGSDITLFRERIVQAWIRDREILAGELHADLRRNEKYFGVHQLRALVLQHTWKNYKDVIPELRKQLTAEKQTAKDQLAQISKIKSGGLDETPLRAMTSNFVASWLGVISDLLTGSAEGNMQMNGQNLHDEIEAIGGWRARFNTPINVNFARQKELPTWDSKLYGGPQLERLLHVFTVMVKNSPDAKLDSAEVTLAIESCDLSLLGGKKTLTPAQATRLVSEIVNRTVKRTFAPLIARLCDGASDSVRRIARIAFYILESRRGDRQRSTSSRQTAGKTEVSMVASAGADSSSALGDLAAMRGFHYFASKLRDIFEDYAERVSERCRKVCQEELKCAEMVYSPDWNGIFSTGELAYSMSPDTIVTACERAVSETTHVLVRNIVLAAHSNFLVAFPRDVSGEILKAVASLDAKDLESMFEMSSVREQLEVSEQTAKTKMTSLEAHEDTLRKLGAAFSRFRTVPA